MHILHISTALTWRGGEQQLAYLLEELKKENCRQSVLCFRYSAIENYCIEQGIQVIGIAKKNAFHPLFWIELKRTCKEKSIDLIHAHDAHAHTAVVLANSILGGKTPFVLSRKVDFPIRNNFFSRFKYKHPTLRKIICVSKKIIEILQEDLGTNAPLTCIYDGIDVNKFSKGGNAHLRQELGIAPEIKLIGNVAALADHKDYYTFVDTAERLIRQGLAARFVLIGDGPEREGITAYINSKKLQQHIQLLGFRTDIAAIFPQLDLLLFTSKTEGLGSSILDAFVCRVPVVATNAGGIPEIVEDMVTGLLAPIKDAEALASQCLRLLSDEALKNKLTEQAQNFVQHFSKEKMGKSTFLVYREVLDRKS